MTSVSPFIHRYTVDGRDYYYHSLTMEIHDSLLNCPSPEHEADLLQLYRAKADEDKGIVMGTLYITTRCPRECAYCFLAGVEQSDITVEEIDRALELIGPGPADLLLYGGEPLLRQDLIVYTAERIRDKGSDIGLILITGGSPVDHSVARLLASLNTFVIVSIDGPPAVNQLSRTLRDSGDSFVSAENTFHAFREAGCRVGISLTVTSLNIKDSKENFLWLMERFKPDDMGLNPWLHPLEKGAANPFQVGEEEAFLAVSTCMEEALKRGMYVEQFARRARPFANRTPRLKDCASSGGRIVVMPGGIAGTCDCMTCRGDHGVSVNDSSGLEELISSFRKLSPVFFPECLDCAALSICGGGCRYDALCISGDIRGRWPDRCAFERRILGWMVEKAVRHGRESLILAGGFRKNAMPMPVGTMLGEGK